MLKPRIRGMTTTLLLSVASLLLAACSGPARAPTPSLTSATGASTIKVRLTHVGNPQTNFGRAAIKFKELAAAKTNGRVQVEVYPDVSTAGGNNLVALQQLQSGAVEATLHSNLIYSNLDPRMEVFSLPYVMTSRQNAYKVVDGEAGRELLQGLEKIGIVGLAYGENGFRQITNSKRPITKPEDMKGLKVRVPETKLYQDTMKALGADPTVMTFSEVYGALQRKDLDGQENPLSVIYPSKLYGVQKYITVWDYSWDTMVLGFNKKFWDSLPQDMQSALRSAAQESMLAEREMVQNDDRTLMEELKKQGMEFTILTTEQKRAFIEATRPVYAASEANLGKDLIEKVRRVGQGG